MQCAHAFLCFPYVMVVRFTVSEIHRIVDVQNVHVVLFQLLAEENILIAIVAESLVEVYLVHQLA